MRANASRKWLQTSQIRGFSFGQIQNGLKSKNRALAKDKSSWVIGVKKRTSSMKSKLEVIAGDGSVQLIHANCSKRFENNDFTLS